MELASSIYGNEPRIFTDSHGSRADRGIDSWFMEAVRPTLKHGELTDKIIGVFYDVYNELGHGFLESTYSEAVHCLG